MTATTLCGSPGTRHATRPLSTSRPALPVPSETVLAVEITLRYGEKRRPARARHDAMARKHRLASYTVQEPLDEMMAEDVPTLTARFARALLECLALGAEEGTLDPVKVGAVRSSAEDRC